MVQTNRCALAENLMITVEEYLTNKHDRLAGTKNYMLSMFLQKQLLELFFRKNCFKIFAIFTGKILCWSLFLNKVTGFRVY